MNPPVRDQMTPPAAAGRNSTDHAPGCRFGIAATAIAAMPNHEYEHEYEQPIPAL
jgi:hypothetical protein